MPPTSRILWLTALAACLTEPEPELEATTSALELPPIAGVVPSEPVGVTPVEHELTPSGAVALKLDLVLPDGRAGMAPDVDLVYSSQGDNGLLGVGWQLTGLSSIARCPKIAAIDGAPEAIQLDGTDAYCLDGSRLIVVGGIAPDLVYRTEDDRLARITRERIGHAFGAWRVELPDGRIARYGTAPASRFEGQWVSYSGSTAPAPTLHPTEIQAWMIAELADRSGNTIVYEYEKAVDPQDEQAYEMRPSRIRYTQHPTAAAQREVRFTYEPRPDVIDRWTAGLHRRESKRLAQIETVVQGARARRYLLGYRNDTITERSLLAHVTECDGAGVCLPRTSFNWNPGSWQFDVIDTTVTDAGVHLESGHQLHVVDVDGDGRDDLLYPDQAHRWWVRLSNGGGFDARVDAGLPHVTYASLARVADFDRDGKTDVLAIECETSVCADEIWTLHQWNGSRFTRRHATTFDANESPDAGVYPFIFDYDGDGLADHVRIDPSTMRWKYQRFTGTGWTALASTGVSLTSLTHGFRVLDHDGDGRSELLRRDLPTTSALTALARTGGAWVNEPTNLPCVSNQDSCSNTGDFRQPDVNGDGLEDAVFPWSGTSAPALKTRFNSGRGFGPDHAGPADYVAPNRFEGGLFRGTSGVITDDLNGDGRDDVVFLFGGNGTGSPGTGIEVYVSRGTELERVDLPHGAGTVTVDGWSTTRTADVDGDGRRDVVQVVNGRVRILRRRGGAPDVITGVNPTLVGTRMRFAYADVGDPAVHTRATSCALPTRCVVRGMTVVSDVWLADGLGGENHRSVRYGGGRRDLRGRGFIGFASRTVTDDALATTTSTSYNLAAVNGHYPFAGVPARVVEAWSVSSGRSGERVVTSTWVDGGGSASLHRPQRTAARTEEFERAGFPFPAPPYRTTDEGWTYDAYGNVTHAERRVAGGSVETVDTSYLNLTPSWILGLPIFTTQTRCTAGTCATRDSSAGYDGAGRVTWAARETTDAPAFYRRFEVANRDAFGNVTVSRAQTTTATRTTTTTYDGEGVYPTGVTDPLGHQRAIEIHPALGVVRRVTDPNGVAFTAEYDGFGRLRHRALAGGAATAFNYLAGATHPLAIREITAGGDDVTVELDALGRMVERRSHDLHGRAVVQDFGYDARGDLASRSRPRFAGAAAQVATFAHDEQGRLIRATTPDGAEQRVAYEQLELRRTDALGRTTRYVHDLDGALVRTDEPHPTVAGQVLTTTYVRGPAGIERVVDPLGNTTRFVFDRLGRRTFATDLDRGAMTYVYDGFDELQRRSHADGSVTTLTRDAGGRVTRLESADGVTTFTYDTAANGVGKLAAAVGPTGIATRFGYDGFGRPASTTWDVDGESFTIAATYDGFGRPATTRYPATAGTSLAPIAITVEHVYGAFGHPRAVRRGGVALWEATDADAEGHVTAQRMGNGVTESRGYDAARGWLESITTRNPLGLTIRDAGYEHDAAGRLVVARDLLTAQFERYTYDRLDRLATWTVGEAAQDLRRTAFAYDAIGNLLGEDVELGPGADAFYTVGGAGFGPHQLAAGPGGAYGYDARGRQVSAPGRTVEFTSFDLPARIDRGDASTTFDYDAFDARVVKRDADEVALTIGELYERRTTAAGVEHRCHVRAAGRNVADIVVRGGVEETRYLHGDRLGSIALTTDGGGNAAERFRYDPFGRRVTTDAIPVPLADARRAGVRAGFTGHAHDDELGLVNMKGRIYDPHTRRFLSADPFAADLTSSQAWNPYSYVGNDPLNAIDPSGFAAEQLPTFELVPGPRSEAEPEGDDETEPECIPDPEPQCESGCAGGDEDAGVNDEMSDGPPGESVPGDDVPFLVAARDENARNGGKGVIYVLDHADAENDLRFKRRLRDVATEVINWGMSHQAEEELEELATAGAIELAEAAGYTVVWVERGITIGELAAVVADDSTVGLIVDAHGNGNTGMHLLDGWTEGEGFQPGDSLRFVIMVSCEPGQMRETWEQAFGTRVYASQGLMSWDRIDNLGWVDHAFETYLLE